MMKSVTILSWLTIGFGFVVSPIVAVGSAFANGTPFSSAASQWIAHLFAPGYNEGFLAVITATPFVAVAVFARFHLAGARHSRGRWAGVIGAVGAGVALTLWALTAIRMSRSSTGAIGYFILPFEDLLAMPIGYLAGRLVARLWEQPGLSRDP